MNKNEEHISKLKERYNSVSHIIESYKLYKLKVSQPHETIENQPHKTIENICWHCTYPFDWDALHLPLSRQKIRNEDHEVVQYIYPNEVGDFCSFPCMKAYLFDKSCFSNSRDRINEYITEQYIRYNRQVNKKNDNPLFLFNPYYNVNEKDLNNSGNIQQKKLKSIDIKSNGLNPNLGQGVNRKNVLIEKRFFLKSNGLPSFESLHAAAPRELLLTGQMTIEEFRDVSNHCVFTVSIPPSLGSSMIIEQFKNIKDNILDQINYYESKIVPKRKLDEQNELTLSVNENMVRGRGKGKGKGKGKKVSKISKESNIIQTLNLFSVPNGTHENKSS